MGLSANSIIQMAMFNILFLIVGMFLDIGSAGLILAPIVTPVMVQLGFDPLHFAMVMLVNGNIGNATPPMGMTLMVASKIGEMPHEKGMRNVLPSLFALLVA